MYTTMQAQQQLVTDLLTPLLLKGPIPTAIFSRSPTLNILIFSMQQMTRWLGIVILSHLLWSGTTWTGRRLQDFVIPWDSKSSLSSVFTAATVTACQQPSLFLLPTEIALRTRPNSTSFSFPTSVLYEWLLFKSYLLFIIIIIACPHTRASLR